MASTVRPRGASGQSGPSLELSSLQRYRLKGRSAQGGTGGRGGRTQGATLAAPAKLLGCAVASRITEHEHASRLHDAHDVGRATAAVAPTPVAPFGQIDHQALPSVDVPDPRRALIVRPQAARSAEDIVRDELGQPTDKPNGEVGGDWRCSAQREQHRPVADPQQTAPRPRFRQWSGSLFA